MRARTSATHSGRRRLRRHERRSRRTAPAALSDHEQGMLMRDPSDGRKHGMVVDVLADLALAG